MIQVDIVREPSGRISSFTMDGHAEFAEHGKDLVCAGATAVSFGTLNAILSLTEARIGIEQEEEGGFLRCYVPEDLPEGIDEKVQLLLEGMVISLQTIEREYSKYISINFHS
ncbi:ribosomal-processing cysteine protease Prp [Bacillus thermotolerans]|uniref:Ribosomal processing cysteine protease Prp n=1 Tax=Bacillus thermotolerans TaxID=1221996 RepID=A0A0F5HP58_BACTR|nr:ribosomal-processing cysteine protease Prp [Bacillus thermotolerans]KKB35086.1 putative ribosomal protein [Bacillus thermotolerans]KKB43414.1 putative ribosomal protein [Bacillus thermotolerans]KKB43465.1 putative ribosomal protein [Bacillus thermotolerans]